MRADRSGVSPIVGTLILLAIVITVGTATWAYANSAVGTTLGTQGTQVASDVNKVREQLVIANVYANLTLPKTISVWIYNSGGVASTIKNVWATDLTTFDNVSPASFPATTVLPGNMTKVTLNIDPTNWSLINVKVEGGYGTTYTHLRGGPAP